MSASVHAADDFTPHLPTKGNPPLLSLSEYPIEKWRAKSATNFPWFVTRGNGWYIDWNCERKPITHLVVHHTAGPGNETPEEISATIRRRVYGTDTNYYTVYRDQNYKTPYVYGLPIHSGHVVEGAETFTAYHFLIYPDGRTVTTLSPHLKIRDAWYVDMVGWGAGNWEINCASVQVALVGTWNKDSPPPPEALRSLKKIIAYYRARIPELKIVGHNEASKRPTTCPGDWWPKWKQKNQ